MSQFQYVEMVCQLSQKLYDDNLRGAGVEAESISYINPGILFDCYRQAFSASDAKFFAQQAEEEQRRYFNEELGFPDVLHCPASFAYQSQGEIIGFALVLPYLENNYHISCMCLLPEFQNQGLGKAMLNRIKNAALENECQTLTLGTETEMKAFHLYKHNGFTVTAEHIVEI